MAIFNCTEVEVQVVRPHAFYFLLYLWEIGKMRPRASRSAHEITTCTRYARARPKMHRDTLS